MFDFETMIFRFRDLSTPSGKTIECHSEIIDENPDNPYTWWGWWNKIGELVPQEAFASINTKIGKDGPLSIYLFDTGSYKFYKADLLKIEWKLGLDKIPSPEPVRTPNYYRDTEYLAWYKLSSITEEPKDNILEKYSYTRVDELFESRRSIFSSFYDKVIASVEELRHQERTIWFIRRKQEEDREREILLYDTGRVYPTNFPHNVVASDSDTFLWLSDIHFSNDKHEFLTKPNPRSQRKTLEKRLEKQIEAEKIESIAGIIISGDLTWRGTVTEFELVAEFIGKLRSRYSLKQNQVIVCPGNHDIRFTRRPWKHDEEVKRVSDNAKANFVNFYKELFSVQPNNYLCCGRRFTVGSGAYVEFVSLNSSLLRQEPNIFQGHGYVGEDQRDHVVKEMKWLSSPNDCYKPFRIVILHHHVVPLLSEIPTFGKIPSTVFDASALLDWFATYEIELVLHGHMHYVKASKQVRDNPQDEKIQHNFNIFSMGSSGVKRQHIEDFAPNTFSLISFKRQNVEIKTIKIYPDRDAPHAERIIKELTIPYKS